MNLYRCVGVFNLLLALLSALNLDWFVFINLLVAARCFYAAEQEEK